MESMPLGGLPLEPQPIDKLRWSGPPLEFEFNEHRQPRLQALVNRAISDLDMLGAGNAEKAQARAYLVALNALSESPEPPSDLIWKLLERGMALVGVCDLFYDIAKAVLAYG